jgi:hypothetical protein
MSRIKNVLPSPSLVVAFMALLITLGGAAVAAKPGPDQPNGVAGINDPGPTPSVADLSFLGLAASAPTTITNLTDAQNGQTVTLRTDTQVTINDGGNFELTGNFVSDGNDTITLIQVFPSWVEVSRSAIAGTN